MHRLLLLAILCTVCALSTRVAIGQTIVAQYLQPGHTASEYDFIRFGSPGGYLGGFMHNKTAGVYGNGDDFTVFTYYNRDLSLQAGTGHIILNHASSATGNVGIGTATPAYKLDVNGSGRFSQALALTPAEGAASQAIFLNHGYGLFVDNTSHGSALNRMWWDGPDGGEFVVGPRAGANYLERVRFRARSYDIEVDGGSFAIDSGTFSHGGDATFSGNVGIGTSTPENELDVNGTARAKEVIVASDWADFVFGEGYRLRSLEEVARFIEEYGRLPEIPSAEEVRAEGVPLGEMQAKLLQKIEELTLYILQQQERIGGLEARLSRVDKD